MREENDIYMICLADIIFVMQRVWIQDVEDEENKGGDGSISQGKRCLEAKRKGRYGRREQVNYTVYLALVPFEY